MELITTHICKALEIGVHGNMFGGTMMSLIDESSAAYAAQLCDTPRMVTIKIDELVKRGGTIITEKREFVEIKRMQSIAHIDQHGRVEWRAE